MRTLLATLAVAAAALPLSGSAHASIVNDCVANLFTSSMPQLTVVTIDPDGRIIVDPHGADASVAAIEGEAGGSVNCIGRCAAEFLLGGSPQPVTLVYVDDQGRIVIDPHGADAFVAANSGRVLAFVDCVL